MSDTYAVVRTSTLTWLLERARVDGELREVPEEVARDLGQAVTGGKASAPDEERLRALGPVLSAEQHLELLQDDRDLDLPRDRQAGQFWRVVARVVHAMLTNEAEAVMQLIGGAK